ncbi:MAG: hypothetical protein ACYTAF_08155 [Planctomycetota bacterium]|jgi:hypothetical protein
MAPAHALLLALLAVLPQADPDEQEKTKELRVGGRVGWQRKCPLDSMVPVWLRFENPGEDRTLEVVLQWALPRDRQGPYFRTLQRLKEKDGPPVSFIWKAPRKSIQRVNVAVRTPGDGDRSLWAYVYEDGGLLKAFEVSGEPVRPRPLHVGIVGRNRIHGLTHLRDIEQFWVHPADLPEMWTAYSSLDALIWLDGLPAACRSPAQHAALRDWVLAGGHLVVARDGPEEIAGHFLEDLLPATLEGSREVLQITALSSFGGTGPGVKVRPPDDPAEQEMIRLLEARALPRHVRLKQGDLPLVMSQARGAGRVTLVAFNPSTVPFGVWQGTDRMWRWILDHPEQDPERARWARSSGRDDVFRDTAGPLARATIEFKGITPPSLSGLFLLLIVYTLVVGPFDYFFLRILARPRMTWLTFPAYVAGFAVLMLAVGGGFVTEPIQGQEIAVYDHHLDEGVSRGWSITSVLPGTDMDFTADGPEGALHMEVLGTAGTLSTDGDILPTNLCRLALRPAGVRDFRLNRSIYAVSYVQWAREEAPPLGIEVAAGRLTFRNTGAAPLTDCMVVEGDRAFEVGALAPGEAVEASRFMTGNDEPWYLVPDRAGGRRFTESFEVSTISLRHYTGWPLLLSLTFAHEDPSRPRSDSIQELAPSMDATRWLAEGGRLFLAWSEAEPVLRYDPAPADMSVTRMIRIFLPPEESND